MLKEEITIDDAVILLNEMLKADNHATASCIATHTPCNDKLANHPTIQVRGYGPCAPSVGLLGVINGLFGINENGFGGIVALYDDGEENNRKLMKFITQKDLDAEQIPKWQKGVESMEEILEAFQSNFGSGSTKKVKTHIKANNIRKPLIGIKNILFRLTTKEMRKFGLWLIEISEKIEKDKDFKNE